MRCRGARGCVQGAWTFRRIPTAHHRGGPRRETRRLAAAHQQDLARLPDDLPLRLVHGDLNRGNLLGHKGQLQGVIDFEDAMGGDPNYDLAYLDIVLGTNWTQREPYDYRRLLLPRIVSSLYEQGRPELMAQRRKALIQILDGPP